MPVITLRRAAQVLSLTLACALPASAAGPDQVEITWLSMANIHYQFGALGVLTDGYISRIPKEEFHGGGGGFAFTRGPHRPDAAAVQRVLQAMGGASRFNLLLTGHSHWDHSFDTATWSRLTAAPIIGSRSTCYQTQAEGLPAARCTAIFGGETYPLAEGITMRVIRWNHSGDPLKNPEQHNPVELCRVPESDAAGGGLRAGVTEHFPNGGGNRAFLFTVDGPQGRYSWFYQNSASAVDLHVPIIMEGRDYGAPLENLKAAMAEAKLDRVDLWIGTGGLAIAQLVAPVIKPKAYLPIHWDGLFEAFERGMPYPFSDPPLEAFLSSSGIELLRPRQFMDKWLLDVGGVHARDNSAEKRALGFSEVQEFAR